MQNRGYPLNFKRGVRYGAALGAWLSTCALGLAPAWGTDVLSMDISARSEAVVAGVAESNGSDALHRNPAGVLGQAYPSVAFTHFTAFQEFAYEQIEGAYPDLGGGCWAARVLYARAFDFTEYDEAGYSVGQVAYHDLVLHAAHARRLNEFWDLGLGLKVFERQLAEYRSRGLALDLGCRYRTPWSPLAVGLALNNLGVQSAFIEQADTLPTHLAAGLALTHSWWEAHRWLGTLDYLHQLVVGDRGGLRLGMEYGFREWLFLRGGLRLENELGNVALGAGVKWNGWGLDYSYRPYDFLGAAHHVTLTFMFLPAAQAAAPMLTPRGLAESTPGDPGMSIKAKGLKPAEVYQVKDLTVLPRNYESSLSYKTPAHTPQIKTWTFEIRDETGKLIRTFSGKSRPPEFIEWDGRDQQGAAVRQDTNFQYVFSANQKPVASKTLPAFQPVLKFRFEQAHVPISRVKFKARTRPESKSWILTMRERPGDRVVRTLSGEGTLPENLIWDGKDEQQHVLDSRKVFDYQLSVTYPDTSQLSIHQKIIPVSAREVSAPPGQGGVLVLGILFDFNSAVLKPEMNDKILAVAELLEDFGSTAHAVCEGHSDDVGGSEYNQKLSLTRAKMVAKFLMNQPGVPAESVSVEGFGKLRPETPGRNEKAREQNRRVEIRVYYPLP